MPTDIEDESTEETIARTVLPQRKINLTAAERVQIEDLLANPAANVHISTNKKGELRVHLTEVQQENLGASAN